MQRILGKFIDWFKKIAGEISKNRKNDETPLKTLTDNELSVALSRHKEWLGWFESEGKRVPGSIKAIESKRAVFDTIDFRGQDFSRKNLSRAILKDCDFRESILKDTNLEKVEGLQAKQLAGTDLSGATLPKYLDIYNGLKTVEEASKNARKLFHIMLAVCAYSFIIMLSTDDADLITNADSFILPFINLSFPILSIYFIIPMAILGFYVYFHIYLQRLWERVASLPATFPDGQDIDEKIYPWLLSGMVRDYFSLIESKRPAFHRFQNLISLFFVWLIASAIAIYYRIELSVFTDTYWEYSASYFVLWTFLLGGRFYVSTIDTLSKKKPFKSSIAVLPKKLIQVILVFIVIGVIFSFYPVQLLVFTNLSNAVVKIKPYSQKSFVSPSSHVVSEMFKVSFNEVDLMGANCFKADFENADLTNTDLRYADFSRANLKRAIFDSSNVKNTIFENADLGEANLGLAIGLTIEQIDSAFNIIGATLPDYLIEEIKADPELSLRYNYIIKD